MKQIIKILILTFLLTNSSFAQLSKVQIEIGSKKLIAEIAETDEEQSEGLMNRPALGKEDTQIPLSIAFINKTNTIVKITNMQPLSLTEHCSGQPIVLALEVNQGWFEQNNIKVGDKILSIKRVN